MVNFRDIIKRKEHRIGETSQLKITHVNPECLDPRFCLPHGEEGEVRYDMGKIFAYIKTKEKINEDLEERIKELEKNDLPC